MSNSRKRVEYAWRPGFPTRGVKASDAARVVNAARGENGIDAAAIVEAAKPRGSPIHRLFTWEDTEAAALWRLREAANLAYHVAVVYVEGGVRTEGRAFVGVASDEDEGLEATDRRHRYYPTDEAMGDPAIAEKVLRRALQDLVAWTARYEALIASSPVAAAIAKAIKRNMPKRAKGRKAA